jgi:NAD(P)-dependent dehydrogenase (short-subunit alcohol dehydrogenase family)
VPCDAFSTKTLETLAAALRAECSVQVLVVTADAAQGELAVEQVLTQLNTLDAGTGGLSLLVNNVGVEFGDPCPLLLKQTQDIDGMIDINVRFSTLMTAKCLPLLLRAGERGSRPRGLHHSDLHGR